MGTAKNHHYLPQGYLRGFARSSSKNAQLHVYDVKRDRWFVTVPRNVGSERDFNRVDVEGKPPDALEAALSELDGQYARVLRWMREEQVLPKGEDFNTLLNLIAAIAIRNPSMRSNIVDFQRRTIEMVADVALSSKARYESIVQQVRNAGTPLNESVPYEEIKRFHDSRAYTIGVPMWRNLQLEMVGMDAVLATLAKRRWKLFVTPDSVAHFITCDRPVILHWDESVSGPARLQPLGHGLTATVLLFPVSSELALVGRYSGEEGVYSATLPTVARINTWMVASAARQVYTSQHRFYIVGPGKEPQLSVTARHVR